MAVVSDLAKVDFTVPENATGGSDLASSCPNSMGGEQHRMPDRDVSVYDINKMVLCKHFDNLYYEAKIVGIQKLDNGETAYKVHYQGWNRRHDEIVSQKEASTRFLPFTRENCQEAKARLKAAQENFKNKKKIKKNVKSDELRDGTYNLGVANKRGTCKQIQSTLIEKNKNLTGSFSGKRRLSSVESIQFKRARNDAGSCVSIPPYLKDIIVDDQTRILNNRRLVRLPARYSVDVIIGRYATFVMSDPSHENSSMLGRNEEREERKSLINDTIKDLFNIMLGTQLLYKFEMLQYSDLVKTKTRHTHSENQSNHEGLNRYQKFGLIKNETDVSMPSSSEDSLSSAKSFEVLQWRPSKTYGFIHLLRFFVKLDCLAKSISSFSLILKWKRRSHQCLIDQLHHFLDFLNNCRTEFYDPDQDYMEASQEYLMRVSEKAAA